MLAVDDVDDVDVELCLGDRFAVPEVEGHNIPSVRQHVDMPESAATASMISH